MPTKKSSRVSKTPRASRPQAAGYGFPENTKGLLAWSWAEQRLKKSHNYWITTVKPDGSPHTVVIRSEEHTSELQSLRHLVCRLLLEKKKRHPVQSRIAA